MSNSIIQSIFSDYENEFLCENWSSRNYFSKYQVAKPEKHVVIEEGQIIIENYLSR